MTIARPILAATPRPSARRAIWALLLREVAATYGRSAGGYLWVVAEPVGAVVIMSVVLGHILRAPGLGQDFPYFYASGYLPFAVFATLSAGLAQTLRTSAPLLGLPAVTLADALIARFLLGIATQACIAAIVVTLVVLPMEHRPFLDWSALCVGAAMLASLGLSVGLANCFLFAAFPIWERIWAILNKPMFFVSGVMFVPEMVPARLRDIMMLNPVAHGIALVRRGFFATYEAGHVVMAYPFLFSLAVGLPGLAFLLARHKDLR